MKKLYLIITVALISLMLCPVVAQARASETINDYEVDIVQGDDRGKINIEFSIRATNVFPKIGALKIVIYKANGDYVMTIWGSSHNGFLSPTSARYYSSSYTYNGTPGTSYYAVVTICAGDVVEYDTRDVQTATVRAPY